MMPEPYLLLAQAVQKDIVDDAELHFLGHFRPLIHFCREMR
jgi:hypothetical protein